MHTIKQLSQHATMVVAGGVTTEHNKYYTAAAIGVTVALVICGTIIWHPELLKALTPSVKAVKTAVAEELEVPAVVSLDGLSDTAKAAIIAAGLAYFRASNRAWDG